MTPRILLQGEDWRIVRIELPSNKRETPEDDGLRELIEVTDGKDLLGNVRWKQLEQKSEGVARYHQICHAMKRMLLECVAAVKETA